MNTKRGGKRPGAGAPRGNANRRLGQETRSTMLFGIRCTPTLRDAVRDAAAAEGVTQSQWILDTLAKELGL